MVVYADNDISATKGDARPRYQALREAIAAGQVAELWAKEQSRIERLELNWFGFAAFAASHGLAQIHTRQEGVIAIGGLVAGVRAVINAHEINTMKGRINDRLAKIAEAGLLPARCRSGTCTGSTARAAGATSSSRSRPRRSAGRLTRCWPGGRCRTWPGSFEIAA